MFCKELQLGNREYKNKLYRYSAVTLWFKENGEKERLVALALAVRRGVSLCCFLKSLSASDFVNVYFLEK